MSSTSRRNRYAIRAKRLCSHCHEVTDQSAVSYRVDPSKSDRPSVSVKHVMWLCDWCGNLNEEVKESVEPTDKTKLVKKLLSLPEEYDVLGLTLSSEPNVISIEIRLPDFDMGQLRAIQWKQRETGFITAEELMKVQRAGYKRPITVPPKPEPRDVATLRKLERQRAFAGESKPTW